MFQFKIFSKVVNEFCRISIESIHKEITNKTLNTASRILFFVLDDQF